MISQTTFSVPGSQKLFITLLSAVLIIAVISSIHSGALAQATDNRGYGMRPAPTVKTLPEKAKRYALVIGVDDYEDTQITTLGGAANDARALADALGRYAGFPSDQVILMASDQPVERRPTRGNILRRLSNLRGAIPKDGMLLVAFAGHGIERGGQAFLLPSDAQVNGDVRLLEDTAINVTRMKEGIKDTGVRQVVFILDACRNDPAGRANVDNPLTQTYTRSFNFDVRNREVEAFVTLYATAVGARAYEYKEKRQGYFTWSLVEALKGRAANSKGEITLATLITYLQEEVPKKVRLDLGKEQRPFANFEGYKADELVLAITNLSLATEMAVTLSRPAVPSADQVLENYFRAVGRAAISQVKTIVQHGTIQVDSDGQKVQGTVELYQKQPDKHLLVMRFNNAVTKEVFNGNIGWLYGSTTGLRQATPRQVEFHRRSKAWEEGNISVVKSLYAKISTRGTEAFDNREVFVLDAVLHNGKSETLYFDSRSGLLLRYDFPFDSVGAQQGIVFTTQIYFEDYIEVNGLNVPTTIRQVSPRQVSIIKLDYAKLKFNVQLDDNLFDKPSR